MRENEQICLFKHPQSKMDLCKHCSGFKKKPPEKSNGFFIVVDTSDLSGELPTHITFKNKKSYPNYEQLFPCGR